MVAVKVDVKVDGGRFFSSLLVLYFGRDLVLTKVFQ